MIERITYIIGNGAGMALDPSFFSLESAIQYVWDLDDIFEEGLSDDEKRRIVQLAGKSRIKNPPTSEAELLTLHRVVSACGVLSGFHTKKVPWLTKQAAAFPLTINYFIGRVAEYFHNYDYHLPTKFIGKFIDHFVENHGHFVTLNYDALFYAPLLDYGMLRGYNGRLVDGFHNSGFDEENLERRYFRKFGWYLHLHGSPLFYEKNSTLYKMKRDKLVNTIHDKTNPYIRPIVLTHFEFKPDVITQSPLLSSYWSYFRRALTESWKVILFGYSGLDKHVNSALADWLQSSKENKIDIIEWSGSGSQRKRSKFWGNELRNPSLRGMSLKLMDNILEHEWGN